MIGRKAIIAEKMINISAILQDLRNKYTKLGEIVCSNVTADIHYVCFKCFCIFKSPDDFQEHHATYHDSIRQIESNVEVATTTSDGIDAEKHKKAAPETLIKMEIEQNVQWNDVAENFIDEIDKDFERVETENSDLYDEAYENREYANAEGYFKETDDDDESECTSGIRCKCCPNKSYACFGLLNEHLFLTRNAEAYHCFECNGIFMSSSQLIRHQKAHTFAQPYECIYCSTIFATFIELRQHQAMNLNVKTEDMSNGALYEYAEEIETTELDNDEDGDESVYVSGEINKKCTTAASPLPIIDKSTEFICDICAKTFRRLNTLKCHLEKAHGAYSTRKKKAHLKCSICANTFQQKIIYADHILTHRLAGEAIKNSLSCALCSNVESTIAALQDHIKCEHNIDTFNESFSCQRCKEECNSKVKLLQHMQNCPSDVTEHKFRCDICGKLLKSRDNLMQHNRSHRGEKPYECRVCHKKFNHSSYINIHMRIHTKEKPYKCDQCGSGFISRSKLTAHIKGHNSIRPHECEECGSKFRTPSTLRDHFRSEHTNERPFRCSVCGRSFAKRKLLLQHSYLHMETKRFQCRYCPIAFSQSAGRHGHEKRIHRT